MDNRSVE